MIAGHFGFAALVKSRERATPLWALMLASQWLDVVFVPLFGTGIERIEPVAGTHGGYGEVTIYADYTHSLVGAVVLSLAFGALTAWRYGRRSGVVLGAVAFSHWVLDLVVHRHDLPILPGDYGGLPRLGLGVWRMPAVAVAIELALVVGGTVAYWRAASATARPVGDAAQRRARLATAVMLATGLLILTLNAFGQ